MGTIIIIAVLVVLVLFAFRGSFAHFKGAAVAVEAVSQSQKRKSWLVKSLLPRLSVLKACTVKTVKIP